MRGHELHRGVGDVPATMSCTWLLAAPAYDHELRAPRACALVLGPGDVQARRFCRGFAKSFAAARCHWGNEWRGVRCVHELDK